jgi:small subunit ribosomal protein S19
VNLEAKVQKLNEDNKKVGVKTWARRCTVPPEFVGHTIAGHNGIKLIPV